MLGLKLIHVSKRGHWLILGYWSSMHLRSSVREGYGGRNKLRWLPKRQVISPERHFCMQSRIKRMCMINLQVTYNPLLCLGWNYATDSCKTCVVLWPHWYISAIYPSNQQVTDYRMVSTPTIHSDKDMKTLLLHMSETCSGHSNAMARAIQSHSHTVGIICQRRISTLHISPHQYGLVMRWIPMAVFLHAISNCGTVSSSNNIPKKTILADWRRIPHITQLLYIVYLPITERFVELEQYVSCTNSCVLVICTHIHGHSAVWMRQAKVCLFLLSTDM